MDSRTLNLLLFSLSFILIFHSPLPANAGVIEKVCEEATYPDVCLGFFKVHPEFASAKDSKQLAKLVLDMAIKKAIETQEYIRGLLKTNPSPPLQHCAEDSYDSVVHSLQGALQGLSSEDPDMANYDAKTAGDDVMDCQQQLNSPAFQNLAELHKRNDEMLTLCRVCSAATY